MSKLTFRNFTTISEPVRALVLAWRNSDRIRLRMTNQQPISPEGHARFVDSLSGRNDVRYFLFLVDGQPVGVLDFCRIDPDAKTCEPGFYIGDERYLGFGFSLCYCALAYAFDVLGCERVTGTIQKDNVASYSIGKRVFGALDVGETANEKLVEFGKARWLTNRESLKNRMSATFGIGEIVWQ